MGSLRNPKHEKFCLELASGKNAADSYVLAGFKPSRQNAGRLRTRDDINARVLELQCNAARSCEITITSICAELDEAIAIAVMMRVLILAATALAISAASASANGYRHHYGYGYATPVFEYEAGAYYAYPAPSYFHTPSPIYAAVPIHAAPVVSASASGYAPGYWGRGYWGGYGYGYGWR